MRSTASAPFVLGTVQLGLDYGIANRVGQPSRNGAFRLLDTAAAAGVRTLDTAHAYGSSEQIIGDWLRMRSDVSVNVITKVPPLQGAGLARAEVAFEQSLERLGLRTLDGLMLHRVGDWTADGIPQWAERLHATGRIGGFGVSVYEPDEIPDDPRIEMVQLPVNAFTPQIATSRSLDRLRERGARIYVRSVFAQGLLLMQTSDLPESAADLRPYLERFHAIAASAAISPAALAMAAAHALVQEAEIVLGAETEQQVKELASGATLAVPAGAVDEVLRLGRRVPAGLCDPRRWTRAA